MIKLVWLAVLIQELKKNYYAKKFQLNLKSKKNYIK
ncbi:MAG: hypothetical protein QT05_C0048G0019 [archaeon GW2011_AR13]|nr:MAG: hypothetical protein QT05_C0048G0019 [archaeon GW2011_AR13]